MFPGGNAVNVAVFAARLGAQSSYLGVVGGDEAGQHVLRSLTQEGVDTSLTRTAAGPNAYADVDSVGADRVFLGSGKGVALFAPDEGQLDAMERFDVVHAGYAGSLFPHLAAMAARTRVSFDFGTRMDLAEAEPMLPHLFLAAFSSSHRDDGQSVALARDVVAAGATYALVTRGSEGAYLASANWVLHQPADLVQVVDTLGAGDAFISSVLVGLLAGRDKRAVLASASAHAAQVCLAPGAFGHGTPFRPATDAGTPARHDKTEVNR